MQFVILYIRLETPTFDRVLSNFVALPNSSRALLILTLSTVCKHEH